MDIRRLNIYERLRDYMVPSTILDDIFSEEKDMKILEDAFSTLVGDGFTEDGAAEKISIMIFKELGIDQDQLLKDEK